MEDKNLYTSPGRLPYSFSIVVLDNSNNNSNLSFEVSSDDPVTRKKKSCRYNLVDREHHSYLDFFEKLSKDFGLRVPLNRQQREEYSFKAVYEELLTENITAGMLYGYGDPSILRVEETDKHPTYYAVVTSNDAPNSFPICRSKNLKDWDFVGFIFPEGNKPEWAADGELISDYWAPEMHKVDDEFRIYFVARDKVTLELCIGMARSTNPEGPFVADKEPILKGDKIDPHVLVDDDDKVFLFWKEDNNGIWPNRLLDLLYKQPSLTTLVFSEKEDQVTASFILTLWPWVKTLQSMEAFQVQQIFIEAVTSEFSGYENKLAELKKSQLIELQKEIQSVIDVMKTPVYAQRLSPDGTRLVGERTKILENDLAWEAHLVEGMWVTKQQGRYYMFYSGNDFSTDQYGIGVAIADAPLGPYKKVQEQILKSSKEWWAPGHPSVAIGPNGKPHLFLHAFFPGKAGYKEFRALLTVPLTFKEDCVLVQ